MKRLTSVLLVLALACTLLFGCGSDAPQQSQQQTEQNTAQETQKPAEIKLAMVGPLTGDSAQYGINYQRGIEMAIEAYNARGGTQVTLDSYDDKNDAKEAVSIANKIIAGGGYAAVVGPFSSTCALAMAEVLDEEKVITISPSCSHEDYVTLYDYTFRLSHVNSYEGEVAARYLKDEFGATKVAAIYSNNDWGISVDAAFVNTAEEEGLEVVANESFIIGQTKDFSASLTKIMQSGAEALYYMGQYTECGLLLKQIDDLGLDIDVLVTTSAYKVESLQLAGDSAEDAVFMASFLNDGTDERITEFEEKFAEKYDGVFDHFALRAYDATMWILDAFDECGTTDPDILRDQIIALASDGRDFVSGYCKLDENRNVEREFFYTEWNGEYDDKANFVRIAD